MSKGKILVTDTLFVFDEHVKKLEDAGYEVVRQGRPDTPEDELCELVKGKVGYLLGGIEHVTDKVIASADQLKVISVAAIDYKFFVPGWKQALDKGIIITNTPDGPTQEVSEWAVAACLLMNREFLELGLIGKKTFAVTRGIEGQKVGMIGMGRVGSKIAGMLKPFKPESISYYSPHRHEGKEKDLGITYKDLEVLLKESEIVFLCASSEAKKLITSEQLKLMKEDALLVNITAPGVIVEEDLLGILEKRKIRAITDHKMSHEGFTKLPTSHYFANKTSNTITVAGAKLMSDTITDSMLNVLGGKEDEYIVNK